MNFSKKGVSTVVANVLIVLLVIVGIAVIWAVVNPTLEKSAKGIQASDCFNVKVKPVSCTTAGTSPRTTVVVQREAGAQSNLYGLKLLITDTATGVTTAQTVTTPLPGELEASSYPLATVAPANSKFNVAAVLGTAASNQVCEVLTQPVNCV